MVGGSLDSLSVKEAIIFITGLSFGLIYALYVAVINGAKGPARASVASFSPYNKTLVKSCTFFLQEFCLLL